MLYSEPATYTSDPGGQRDPFLLGVDSTVGWIWGCAFQEREKGDAPRSLYPWNWNVSCIRARALQVLFKMMRPTFTTMLRRERYIFS